MSGPEILAGRYRLEHELGRGGMAIVYRALDQRLSRAVAVKLMHPSRDDAARERFAREAEIVASLKHANILEIHDFGEDPVRGPFLVTELVEGQSLRAWMEKLGPLTEVPAALIAWELSRALALAHRRGVVHRDVKPENVLIAERGPLKLADFGIAAMEDHERLTSTGAITGSLPYMAPERLDDGRFSPASDVYAAGVILFELCAGRTPFSGKGAAHLAAAAMVKDAPKLEEHALGVGPALCELVAQCLSKDSKLRPVDGGALEGRLEDWLRAEVGSPSDAAAALFNNPVSEAARHRQATFDRRVAEGQQLLKDGRGAQAARVLDAALKLKPGAPEVLSLLRRPTSRGLDKRWLALGLAVVSAGVVFAKVAPTLATDDALPAPAGSLPDAAVAALAPAPGAMTGRDEAESGFAGEGTMNGHAPSSASASVDDRRAPSGTATQVSADERPSTPTAPARADRTASSASNPKAARLAATGSSAADAPSGKPSSASASAPAPADATGGEGKLKLSTRPWAEVLIDGVSLGYTPRVRELTLSAGPHRLELINRLCDVHAERLDIPKGGIISRDIQLRMRKAELVVRGPAGARLFIDGVETGTFPLSGALAIDHGRHTLTAHQVDGKQHKRELELTAGQRVELDLSSP